MLIKQATLDISSKLNTMTCERDAIYNKLTISENLNDNQTTKIDSLQANINGHVFTITELEKRFKYYRINQ